MLYLSSVFHWGSATKDKESAFVIQKWINEFYLTEACSASLLMGIGKRIYCDVLRSMETEICQRKAKEGILHRCRVWRQITLQTYICWISWSHHALQWGHICIFVENKTDRILLSLIKDCWKGKNEMSQTLQWKGVIWQPALMRTYVRCVCASFCTPSK